VITGRATATLFDEIALRSEVDASVNESAVWLVALPFFKIRQMPLLLTAIITANAILSAGAIDKQGASQAER
jgi:hypothetical protein